MYRKVTLSSFHNGKVEYCTTFGSGDIEKNASVIFFTQTLVASPLKNYSAPKMDEWIQ